MIWHWYVKGKSLGKSLQHLDTCNTQFKYGGIKQGTSAATQVIINRTPAQ